MKKIIFTIFFIGSTHLLFAQYLHYWDHSRPPNYTAPVPEKNTPPAVINKPEENDPPIEITKPLKIDPITLVSAVWLPVNQVAVAPKFDRPPMIFHEWPDKCPALSGSLPVLDNYVPAEIVIIITEKFKGHLYSISSYNGPDNQLQYKLKVCSGGMIKYEYADHKGNIISEEEE